MSQPPQPPTSGEPQPGEPYPGHPQPDPTQYPATPYSSPYSGEPNPDVPTSVPPQPGYPGAVQPGYAPPGQPGYPSAGQPGYPPAGGQPMPYPPSPYAPYPGFPQPPVQPPKAKSRTLPIVLTSIAIFLVLCLGGSTAVVLVLRNQDDKLTSADATPEPASSPTTEDPTQEPSAQPSTPAASTVKVVAPKTLGGRPKVSSKELQSYVDLLKTMMSSYPSASNSVSGMYGRIGTRNVVVMAAAEADVVLPETTVDALLASGGSSTKVTGITSVSTGSLGGYAKCGNSTSAGQKLAICVWADDGSLGLVVWYFKSTSSIKSEFPKVRAEIEKKA
ncbi:hypothetical protein HH310_23800 [Actinoplanes sp. TBRC 11911]|uniref:hypothetical protein n=1 Tax=Actinoplanes sp. TBRC 11911 TaxID=2729386 RepID=UPI00145EA3E1|nr:hypothetical protein [Actinoplanes sp. TBRC 11911]NMO54194.1 hypothetical protein [Actinoplanes sp. TBRC 11911]